MEKPNTTLYHFLQPNDPKGMRLVDLEEHKTALEALKSALADEKGHVEQVIEKCLAEIESARHILTDRDAFHAFMRAAYEQDLKEKIEELVKEEGSHIQEMIDYAARILERAPGKAQSFFGDLLGLGSRPQADRPTAWRSIRPRIRGVIARCTIEQVAKSEISTLVTEEAKRLLKKLLKKRRGC